MSPHRSFGFNSFPPNIPFKNITAFPKYRYSRVPRRRGGWDVLPSGFGGVQSGSAHARSLGAAPCALPCSSSTSHAAGRRPEQDSGCGTPGPPSTSGGDRVRMLGCPCRPRCSELDCCGPFQRESPARAGAQVFRVALLGVSPIR